MYNIAGDNNATLKIDSNDGETMYAWFEENHLLGGNFDLSISMATTFMINTHIGLSNMSGSFLTKPMALKH